MGAMASQITSLSIVYSTIYSAADQRKHQSSASLAFVRGIHRWPVNSPHKWPITRKMFPFDDVVMMRNRSILWMLMPWFFCFTKSSEAMVLTKLDKQALVFHECIIAVLRNDGKCKHSFMMMSSNGNIFRITGPLCGEFTGHRLIPHTKASEAELWCFLWSAPE